MSERTACFSCWKQGLIKLGIEERGAMFFVGASDDSWNKRET